MPAAGALQSQRCAFAVQLFDVASTNFAVCFVQLIDDGTGSASSRRMAAAAG
jgi:hypothetical protein